MKQYGRGMQQGILINHGLVIWKFVEGLPQFIEYMLNILAAGLFQHSQKFRKEILGEAGNMKRIE